MAPVQQRHLRISRLDGVHRPDIWPPVLDGEPPGVVVKDRLDKAYCALKPRKEGCCLPLVAAWQGMASVVTDCNKMVLIVPDLPYIDGVGRRQVAPSCL